MMISKTWKGQILHAALASITLAIVLISRPVHAEIQNDAIGFSTNHVFESSQAGENIDTMTGNMTLSIPIGPRYKLHDTFSYGVTLYYNAKIWDHECPEDATINTPCPGELIAPDTYGLGFSIWPARIYHKPLDKVYVYRVVMEDGSEHMFCDPSNNQFPDCESPFTIDSARMRVEELRSGNIWTGWVVYPGDGRKIILQEPAGPDRAAYVTKIESVEAATQWVSYNYDHSVGHRSGALVSISDSQDRVIEFGGGNDGLEIRFPKFTAQETLSSQKTVYTLQIGGFSVYDPADGVGQDIPDDAINTRVLSAILYHDLQPTESYRFAYSRGTVDEHPRGWMLQRTIPTGAVTDYFYQQYWTSKKRPYHTELTMKRLTTGTGASAKSFQWTWKRFSGQLIYEAPAPGHGMDESPQEAKSFRGSNPHYVRMLDPFGNLTTYRFHYTLYNDVGCPAGDCPNNWDDGLLYEVATYAGPQPDDNRLIQLTTHAWEADRHSVTDAPKMFQYRAGRSVSSPASCNSMVKKAYQKEERTIVPSSSSFSGRISVIKSSDFLIGRPRQRDEYLNGSLYRSTYTDLDPNDGSVDAHRFVRVTDASGAVVSRVDRRFNLGRVECEVRRKGAEGNVLGSCEEGTLGLNRHPGDIATVNTFDPSTGLLQSTVIKGGDDLTEQLIDPEYLPGAGYLKTKKIGNVQWKVIDRSVDFNTGLPFQTRDPAGNTVGYDWDDLGRLKSVSPDSPERATTISYPSLRQTEVRQQLGATNLIESIYNYDELGRLVQTRRRNVDNNYDSQWTEYDAANRVTRRSEWALGSTATALLKWTTYDYSATFQPLAPIPGYQSNPPDPLGRIRGVTTPDDLTPETPTTETLYYGNTTVVKVRDIRGSVNDNEALLTSTTRYVNDDLGRLIEVDAPGTGADAQYDYDAQDHLTEVRLVDPAEPTHVQRRNFTYDALGRLTSATNPENGTTQYKGYDARGNLLEFADSRGTTFNMAYDLLDRLLAKTQHAGATDLLLVENVYDQGVGFESGGSVGKLVQQKSYEIVGSQALLTSQARFGYGSPTRAANSDVECPVSSRGYTGLNGRLSWQSTWIPPWTGEYRTDHCQDVVGSPSLLAYPDYTSSGRTRTMVGYSRHNGYLWQMQDEGRALFYFRNVAYAPGGVPKEITRGNWLVDKVELDLRSRPQRILTLGFPGIIFPEIPPECDQPIGDRPRELVIGDCSGEAVPQPSPAAPLWDSGVYAYDMAGNIKAIGADNYYYDELSRLTRSVMLASDTNHDLKYSYDGFGNMKEQRDTYSIGPPKLRLYSMDWLTNRITQQVVEGIGPEFALAYSFDSGGNMTAEGGRGFVYDGSGRLRELTSSTSGVLGTYHYDASGYRVKTEVAGQETYYFRDSTGQELSEFRKVVGAAVTVEPAWVKDYVYAFGKSFAIINNEVPKAPAALWVESKSATGMRIRWAATTDPDLLGYSLQRTYRRDVACTELGPVSHNIPVGVTYWDETFPTSPTSGCGEGALTETTKFTYTLQALDSASNLGDLSPLLVVRPGPRPDPVAPSNLVATASNRAVTLAWGGVGSPATGMWGYIVERQPAGGAFVQVNAMPVTQPRFYDTGLANGVTYSYRVKSIDTALRQSVPSTLASAMPKDANPPGRLTDVKATPEREAGQIKVSWRRGYEADVAYYQVFRSTDPDDLGQELTGGDSHILPVVNQDRYSVIDENATQGHTYYYSVNVVDGASNVSTASEHVSARPRHSALTRPHLTKTIEYQLIEGTTSTDGTPQGNKNGSDVSAEDDDVAQAALDWLPGPTGTSRFSIYRKASDEDDYVLVGTLDPPFPSLPRYSDSTLTKGDYTYYVTRSALVGTDTEESPGSDPPNPNWARVVHPYPTNASVRNLMMTDSRREYTTYNRESRGIRVDWSRVPEPELRGYNVYRMCALGLCSEGESMDTFACEPDWVRVNESIVPPDTRHFADSSVGGLKGCFMYAIRPVGPFFVEGPITKVVESSVRGGQDMSANKEYDTDATAAYFYDNPTQDYVYIDTALDAIKDVPRGTGGSDGPPSPPTSASRVVFRKLGSFAPEGSSGRLQEPARIAQVNWVMPSPNTLPSDLRGFHIEMAGSPDGPWKRVTNRPVAWWERRYSVQGVDLEWGFRLTSHMEACASFRVISVDEDGNESAPRAAGNNPDSTLCPMTPAAPTNLRATSVGVGTLEEDNIRLDWDASPGATKYFVYRLMLLNDRPFFYPTSETTVNYYDERGNDYDRTVDTLETVCPYEPRVNACRIAELEAYYVTARKVIPGSLNPGESPRSNLVFITWGAEPVYAKSTKSAEPPVDAIAAAPEAEPELLACWQSGPEGMMLPGDQSAVSAMEAEFAAMSPHDSFRTDLTTAPMRTLGTLNPPWALLNLHTDHLGSVRLVTDANGTVLSEHKYFPFGEPMLGEAYFYNTHKFTGHERDAESGMDYMLARYYSSSQSRFLSTDPVAIKPERLRIPQRLNLYTYAANNPIKFFDPTGEDVEVGNRAVKGTLGIGAHAFIIVKPTGANVEKFKDRTDPKTGTITLSGHPKDGNLVRTQNDARDVGKATQTINVAAPKGTSMEKFEANVIQASDSYKNDAKYEATPGPGTYNSNSLASGTLKAAGSDHTPTTSDLDGYNAGWDQAVPLPDATADDSPKPEEQPKKEEKKQP